MFQTYYMFHQLEKICILYHVIYWLVALTHHQQVCSSPQPTIPFALTPQPDHLRGYTYIPLISPWHILILDTWIPTVSGMYPFMYTYNIYLYIWANYNNSLTWIKAIWGSFPLLTMIPVRSQWGRYNLPRYIHTHIFFFISGDLFKGVWVSVAKSCYLMVFFLC